jgi:DNA-binding NarL/FixJ family response regulator
VARVKIVLADDHPLFREALAARVQRMYPDASLAEVGSLDEAVGAAAASEESVQLFLLDYAMPGVSNSKLQQLIEDFPDARVAVISGAAEPEDVRSVIMAGVHGFIPKTAKPDYLQNALQMLLGGGTCVPVEYLRGDAAAAPADWADKLTGREMDVFRGLARGLSNKEIGRELGLAEVTVKIHVSSIFRKTGAHTRSEAAVLASRAHLS